MKLNYNGILFFVLFFYGNTAVRQNTNFHNCVHVVVVTKATRIAAENVDTCDTNQTLKESHIVPILQYSNVNTIPFSGVIFRKQPP